MVSISTLEQLDCRMPPEVLKKFNARKDSFQMMPDAAVQALELVKDPSCELSLVARTIEKDVKLSTSILTVANSPIYSPGRPITSVRDAIINVGFRQCQTLIQACCARSLMQSVSVDRATGDAVIHHCLATAAFSSSINKTVGLGFQGEEFTAGLLHDLGRLLIGALFPEEFQALHRVQVLDTAESLLQEQEIIGTDHTVVGCYFGIANRLPNELKEAIRFHHTPEFATCAPELTAATAVADKLASHYVNHGVSDYDIVGNPYLGAFEESCGQEATGNLKTRIADVFEMAEGILSSFASSN